MAAEWTEYNNAMDKINGLFTEVTDGIGEMWKKNSFPLFGIKFKFTTILMAYFGVLVLSIGLSLYLDRSREASVGVYLDSSPDLDAIKAEMRRVYKEHLPANVDKVLLCASEVVLNI